MADRVALFREGVDKYEARTGGAPRAAARYLVQQIPELSDVGSAGALVHDNACGTAAVYEEIVSRCRSRGEEPPRAHATDVSPEMVEFAKARVASLNLDDRVTARTMPGEKLDFPDETFTHSITNMGLIFFKDGEAGIREIYRTLKPGGVAAVSTWGKQGLPIDRIAQPAHMDVRPNDTPLAMPVDSRWRNSEYVIRVLEDAGFQEVRLLTTDVLYGQKSEEELHESMVLVSQMLGNYKEWSEEEKEKFSEAVWKHVRKETTPCKLMDGTDGIGFTIDAMFLVGRKPM